MYGSSLASAGRRFLKKSGFALLQASLFGALLGALVYYRVPSTREEAPDERPWHERLRGRLEAFELGFYDWRARDLGKSSKRSDAVVLVPIDEETVASARRDEHPGLGIQPWPREIVGGVVDRLVAEGASLVLVDLLFSDLSPSLCFNPGLAGGSLRSDDDAFRSLLDRHPGRAVLGFTWQEERGPPASSPPKPYLLQLANRATPNASREWVRRVLVARRPAFVIPEGPTLSVWVGVASEEEARAVAKQLEVGPNLVVHELLPAERAYQKTPADLLLSISEVHVEGLDPAAVPRAYGLTQPVAELLSDRVLYGSLSTSQNLDGKVRGIHHLINFVGLDGQPHFLPSAALAAAMQLAGTRELKYAGGRLWVGNRFSVPMDESGYSLIRWETPEAARDGRGSLKRSVSAWRVVVNLFDKIQGTPPHYRNDLDNRVAVLANTSRTSSDFVETPIGRASGGGLHGQALANLLRSEGVTRVDPRVDFLATVAMAFLGALLSLTLGGGVRSMSGLLASGLGFLVLAGGYLWVSRHVFLVNQQWIAVAGPLLAAGAAFVLTALYAARTERQIFTLVRRALGRAASPEVARQVTSNLSLMRPARREVTFYFSDIEGFSRLAEQLAPEQLARLVNEYLSEMIQVVRRNGGQLDKYVGDALSAFWGAPLKMSRHAERACEAALAMREVLSRRRAEWERRFGQRLEFRAGLNTGVAVVGDMGTELQSNYTVLGDVVAFASRLERSNRVYGTFILVGEATARACSRHFVFREVDRIRASGGGEARPIFELLGRAAAGVADPAGLDLYQRALKAYYARRFLEAIDLFSQLGSDGKDPVAAVYIQRCDRYLGTPPGEDWDGVFEGVPAPASASSR